MKLLEKLIRSRPAPHAGPPVDPTEGEATSLLTQTAGAVFGLLPALMAARTASAAPAQHGAREGDAADSGDHASAPSGSELAHGLASGTISMGQATSHDVPSTAVEHGHDAQGAASQAMQDGLTNVPAMQVASAAAHGSGAPQPLVLPGAVHGTEDHVSPLGDAAQPTQDAASVFMQAQDAVPSMATFAAEASHALGGASASIGDAAHAATSIIALDLSQTAAHVGDGLSAVSAGVVGGLNGALTSVGGLALGGVTHATEGLVQHAAATVAGAADAGPHIASSVVDAAAGSSASLVQDAHAALTDATHLATDVTSHLAAPMPNAPAVTSAHAATPPSVVAGAAHLVSDVAHVASLTSDGSPLHIPLIGQSYMDDSAAHDAGFSLHALHGL